MKPKPTKSINQYDKVHLLGQNRMVFFINTKKKNLLNFYQYGTSQEDDDNPYADFNSGNV